MAQERAKPLATCLPVETKTCFPLSDGRELRLGRGAVPCLVSFQLADDRHQYADESDWLLTRLELADREGRLFRLERRLQAHVLLELIRTARHHHLGEPELILTGVHCGFDHRSYIPTAALVGDRVVALGYHTKYFMADLDLLTYRGNGGFDDLVIRVPPLEGSGLAGPTPLISVSTNWAGRVAAWPGLMAEGYSPYGQQPVFTPTEELGQPQPLVEVV